MNINWKRLKALGGAILLTTSMSACSNIDIQETEITDCTQIVENKNLDLNPTMEKIEVKQKELEQQTETDSINIENNTLYSVQDLYVLGLYYIHSLDPTKTNKDISYEIITLSDPVIISDYDDCAICHLIGKAKNTGIVKTRIAQSIFDENRQGYMISHEFYDEQENIQYFDELIGDFGYWHYSTMMDPNFLTEPRDVLTLPLGGLLSQTTYENYKVLTLEQLQDVSNQLNATYSDNKVLTR